MSTRALLSGDVDETVRLRREIADLEQELKEAKAAATAAKQGAADAVQAIRALRHQLEPIYKALKMVFGEISRADVGSVGAPASESSSSGLSPKWQMMKNKLGGRQAEFIDLLQHGEMTTAQLAAAAGCHRDTVAQVIHKLSQAQLINKNGGKFSLKEL